MSAEPKALVLRTPEEKAERKALRRARRDEHLADLRQRIEASSIEDVQLKENIGLDDSELQAKGLTRQQIYKVREWEKPKKAIAFGLEASNQHVTAMLRAVREQPRLEVNVEKLIIKLPEKKSVGLPEPVVIDVEVSQK